LKRARIFFGKLGLVIVKKGCRMIVYSAKWVAIIKFASQKDIFQSLLFEARFIVDSFWEET
jgi:hypothetical protein